jgi:hypothetical protein
MTIVQRINQPKKLIECKALRKIKMENEKKELSMQEFANCVFDSFENVQTAFDKVSKELVMLKERVSKLESELEEKENAKNKTNT